MAKEAAPAFQFYPKDFLSDGNQAGLSAQECGVYARLLCYCWLEESIPDDVVRLGRLGGVSTPHMRRMWPTLQRLFHRQEDGRWRHGRLDKEREKQDKFTSRQSRNGARNGKAKHEPNRSQNIAKGEGDGESDLDHLSLERKNVFAFEDFWAAYPRKDGKKAARTEWDRLNPNEQTQRLIAADLERRKHSTQWLKDGGQFVPHARTYLHQERFEDGFVEQPRLSERTINVLKGFEEPA